MNTHPVIDLSAQKPSTILIMAGGTGGHIFPGIAVAELLQKHGWTIHWLGTEDRMEAQIVPNHGFDLSFINIKGIRHKGWKTMLAMPFKLVKSVYQAMRVIKHIKPDVVLGMGGYASAPGGFAAWLLGKPLVLHEQNAVAGLTNRFLAKFASQVLCAFPGAFKKQIKHQVTGNPLRASIVASEKLAQEENRSNILVVGGSLGAKALNDVLPQALPLLDSQQYSVWHQSGKGHKGTLEAEYAKENALTDKVKVTEFIDDMAEAYAWADVVICRAGALTVSEVAMAGKPAIFVPLPHAVDDHQTRNAMYLVEQGAAKIVPQKQLSKECLATTLNELLNKKDVLSRMGVAALKAAHSDATELVANICAREVKS